MPTITEVKKDRIFYKGFYSLIETLKSIAGSQFHVAEKRIKIYNEVTQALEEIAGSLDLRTANHPMINPGDLPTGIVVVSSDAGLVGGMNYRMMTRAMDFVRERGGRLMVVGLQGKKFAMKTDLDVVFFPGVIDTECFRQAGELTDYLLGEVRAGRIGPVKILFPYASSIASQHIVEWDLLPCAAWPMARLPAGHGESHSSHETPARTADVSTGDMVMESLAGDIVEYAASLWIRRKICDIFHFNRVAEYAARIVHLEESSQRVKEIEHKLRLKYFRIHHEIIDQQMRELFTARSLYA